MQIHIAASQTIDERWHHPAVHDPFWRLYRNGAAGARLEVAGDRFPLQAGHVYLIPAWFAFGTACAGKVPHQYVHFDPGLPAVLVRRLGDRIRGFAPSVRVARRFTAWSRAPRHPAAGHRLRALLHDLVADLLAERPAAELAVLDLPLALQAAVRLVETDPARARTVADLAAACHLGSDHFSRLWRRHTGQHPSRWLREQKVTSAARLLLTTEQSIEQISERLGFANRFHFTRVFTRLLRLSPARYRRAARPG